MFRVVIVCTLVLILVPITATTSIISVTCSSALVCITTTTTTTTSIPTAISVRVLAAFFGWPLWKSAVAGAAICRSFIFLLTTIAATDNPVFRGEINYYIENRIAEDARTRSRAPLRLVGVRRRSINRLGMRLFSASKRVSVARLCDMIKRRNRCKSCMMSRDPLREQIGHY
jgi:hypothetical protein